MILSTTGMVVAEQIYEMNSSMLMLLNRALHCSAGRALFIHVPPLGKPYTANQLAEAIAIVLKAIVKMIEN